MPYFAFNQRKSGKSVESDLDSTVNFEAERDRLVFFYAEATMPASHDVTLLGENCWQVFPRENIQKTEHFVIVERQSQNLLYWLKGWPNQIE